MNRLTILRPSDLHVHVRQGEILGDLATLTAQHFAYIMPMPNTTPAKETGPQVMAYLEEIKPYIGWTKLVGIMKITTNTTAEIIQEARALGVRAGKLYFGITTNNAEGERSIEPFFPAFKAMEEAGMILCIHGERAYDATGKKIINLRREIAFLPFAQKIITTFPNLKIVLEHITTKEAVALVVRAGSNVAATITVQHLQSDIDAVLGFVDESGGEGINPHNYCKPVLKYPEDREALIRAATSQSGKFFFGSDSAPHSIDKKECCCGKPGVFSALTRIQTLAELFENERKLDTLEGFASIFGPQFYGLPLPEDTITLVKEPWVVPSEYAGVRHYQSGAQIQWKIV